MEYKKLLFGSNFNGNNDIGYINSHESGQTNFSFGQEAKNMQNQMDLAAYLHKDFQDSYAKIEDNEYRVESCKKEIINLKTTLPAYGFSGLGDLFNPTINDIEATIKCIVSMLHQRQKDLEFRSEIFEKMRRLENERITLNQNIDRLTSSKRQTEQENQSLQNKVKLLEKSLKDERDKATSEKDELNKQIIKIQNREQQYLHENRKKENMFKSMQDQLKKYQTDKNVQFKNNFEITQLLESKGPVLFSGNSENEFTYMITKGYEEIHNKLLTENDFLRESIATIQKELNDIISQKKDIYLRRKKLELGDEYNEDLDSADIITLKKDLFNMPLDNVGKETLDILQENIRKFKDFIQKLDMGINSGNMETENALETGENEIEKMKCIKSLRALLGNYKYVVETQDALLNKAIIKTNNIKPSEQLNYKNSRLNILDDKELEKARQFLLEQKSYLEEKSKDIQYSRELYNETTKRLEEEKISITKRRQEIEEETEKFKGSLQEISARNRAFLDELTKTTDDSMQIETDGKKLKMNQ